jgi:hypothetical protein
MLEPENPGDDKLPPPPTPLKDTTKIDGKDMATPESDEEPEEPKQ